MLPPLRPNFSQKVAQRTHTSETALSFMVSCTLGHGVAWGGMGWHEVAWGGMRWHGTMVGLRAGPRTGWGKLGKVDGADEG